MPHPPPKPPMTDAATYYPDHEPAPALFSEYARKSPIAKPYPISQGPLIRHLYTSPGYQSHGHPFIPSYNSFPESPESLSGSSTASYSHSESVREHETRREAATFSLADQAERGVRTNQSPRELGTHSEKATRSPTRTSSTPRESSRPVDATVFTYTRDDDTMPEPKDHVLWVLMCLSCLTPFFSLFAALFTVLGTILLLFLTPLRLIRGRSSFRDQTSRLLSPLLNFHLRMICAHESVADSTRPPSAYDVPVLFMVHLMSPFLSIGVACAAWVAASFWIFTAIMGNPDGTERKDDGKAAVIGVRNWWERWLARAIR